MGGQDWNQRAADTSRASVRSLTPGFLLDWLTATVERPTSRATHIVFNQAPALQDYNMFDADRTLVEALHREGAEWAEDRARELGAICGSRQTIRWGFDANEKTPELRTHDRYGNRIDEVEFDSSWHELMRIGTGHGLHASPWTDPGPGAHVARAAMFMLLMQTESGVGCPISGTYSAIPPLRMQPDVQAAGAEPRLDSFVASLRGEVPGDDETIQTRARSIVKRMALALQASLLVRYGDQAVADAFCASRLDGEWGNAFGTLPAGVDFGRIIERHQPSS